MLSLVIRLGGKDTHLCFLKLFGFQLPPSRPGGREDPFLGANFKTQYGINPVRGI